MTRHPPRHPFTPDPGITNWRGDPLCTCGQARTYRVHQLPAVPAHVTEAEARRLGEHEGDQ